MRARVALFWLSLLTACGARTELLDEATEARASAAGATSSTGMAGSGGKLAAGCHVSSMTEIELGDPSHAAARMTSGPDGNLWFTEMESNLIGRSTLEGAITEFPIPTPGAYPLSIVSGPEGALWFTEMEEARVARITTAGVISEFATPTELSFPYGITVGPGASLWFTELNNNAIGRLTPDGVIMDFGILSSLIVVPTGIVAGSDGNLWYTAAKGGKAEVGRLGPSGEFQEFPLPNPDSAAGWIGAGSDGAVWFSEWQGQNIGRITTQGVLTEFPIPSSAYDLTLGPDHNWWFTEKKMPGMIGCMTSTGAVTEFSIPAQRASPGGITSASDGSIWFTEYAQTESKLVRIAL